MTRPAAEGGPGSGTGALRRMLSRSVGLRFLVAGAVNTAFGYIAFLVCLALVPSPLGALTLATAVAILFNFVSLGSYVFRAPDPARLWRFGLVYGLVYAFNAAGLSVLVAAGVPAWLAGLLLVAPAAGFSFWLNRAFVFRVAS